MRFLVGEVGWIYTSPEEIGAELGITAEEVQGHVVATLGVLRRAWQRDYFGPQLTWLNDDPTIPDDQAGGCG